MAARKKAKRKSKPKRKKARAKPKKAKALRKRASAKKARRPAKAAKRKPAKRKPAKPAEPPPPGPRVGIVTHYFGEPSVAVIKLERGTLRVGDTIHIRGHTTDFEQRVESMQV